MFCSVCGIGKVDRSCVLAEEIMVYGKFLISQKFGELNRLWKTDINYSPTTLPLVSNLFQMFYGLRCWKLPSLQNMETCRYYCVVGRLLGLQLMVLYMHLKHFPKASEMALYKILLKIWVLVTVTWFCIYFA